MPKINFRKICDLTCTFIIAFGIGLFIGISIYKIKDLMLDFTPHTNPNVEYKVGYNAFPLNKRITYEEYARNTKTLTNTNLKKIHFHDNIGIEFDNNHILTNKLSHNNEIPYEIYETLLNKIGHELKFVGNYTCDTTIDRTEPSYLNLNLEMNWHFDRYGKDSNNVTPYKYTLCTELYNDFGDGSLDIAENIADDPIKNHNNCIPGNGIKVNYPNNGYIIFAGKEGKQIHRMTTINGNKITDKSFTRSVCCIFIK